MKQITIDEATAREMYKMNSDDIRAMLETQFGKQTFSETITDRIKTMEDVYRALNIDPKDAIPYRLPISRDQHAANSFVKATLLVKALNEGWTPDWKNKSEYKYWPWFDMSGSGLVYDLCGYGYAASGVGSRLCFKSKELAEYAAKQFKVIYEGFML
jgi:hypothetical protein